jgi:hypothetical protein
VQYTATKSAASAKSFPSSDETSAKQQIREQAEDDRKFVEAVLRPNLPNVRSDERDSRRRGCTQNAETMMSLSAHPRA